MLSKTIRSTHFFSLTKKSTKKSTGLHIRSKKKYFKNILVSKLNLEEKGDDQESWNSEKSVGRKLEKKNVVEEDDEGEAWVSTEISAELKSEKKRVRPIDTASVLSVFDMYSIGIGPSSSHTVGPMRAANHFVKKVKQMGIMDKVKYVKVEVYGSLALTGEGHGTPRAILMGLEGEAPESIDPSGIRDRIIGIRTKGVLTLDGTHPVKFENSFLMLKKNKFLDFHSNGMKMFAYGENDQEIFTNVYYSVGGGFVVEESQIGDTVKEISKKIPYHYSTAKELLQFCNSSGLTIDEIQMRNELALGRTEEEIRKKLMSIWGVMNDSAERGMNSKEVYLPGHLRVLRRAPHMHETLIQRGVTRVNLIRSKESGDVEGSVKLTGLLLDWVSTYAIAVNEENAAGGRVVTAPTNGAAGVIPAVLRYYVKWLLPEKEKLTEEDVVVKFLLTAGAIGILFKKGASISAAEVGCQGEIGVACSMAAAGLCELLGGTPMQVSAAAEIGMEHNLGMTCDPIGGLVQVPCIERNAMGGIKAINASRLALFRYEGSLVSLDDVITTMLETGYNMQTKYKETSSGGLAINVGMSEC